MGITEQSAAQHETDRSTAAPRRTTPTRYPDRMHDDRATVHSILDEALFCHLAFVGTDGAPLVLPTLHLRIDDVLYVHASTASRPMRLARGDGLPVCVAVTILDGIVYTRSQFDHSLNYRSVIAHGVATTVTDDATKRRVLSALVDRVGPGRSADSRPPTTKELAKTALLALTLTEAAAKVRAGGPSEDETDRGLPFWAGVLPVGLSAGRPRSEAPDTPAPPYLDRINGLDRPPTA